MKKTLLFIFLLLIVAGYYTKVYGQELCSLRAPAYPLITIDPYTSGWSFTDRLYDEPVKHWTGKELPLLGAIRVDGQTYRFMGTEETETRAIVKNSEQEQWNGKYVFDDPGAGWEKLSFNDTGWETGSAAFGTKNSESAIETSWKTEHIWVRREVIFEKDIITREPVFLELSHDDDAEIYINGIEIVNTGNSARENVMIKLPDNAKKTLKKGRNVIAAHCRNRVGNALLDFGLYVEMPLKKTFNQTAVQKSVVVLPTQTVYMFTCGSVDLKLTFTAPLLMHATELMSRPVNYISYEAKSNDGKSHAVEIYLEAGTAWALNVPNQESYSETFEKDDFLYLKTGSKKQAILGKKGDNVRIDWGYFYLCAEKSNTNTAAGSGPAMRATFSNQGMVIKEKIPASLNGHDKLTISRSLGKVNGATTGYFMSGYDDLYSIQYFGVNLRPYWNRNGDKDIFFAFSQAAREYHSLKRECDRFDTEMMQVAGKAGGNKYAALCALAYRQAISAHKLAEAPNGDLLFLSKENFSNGSIGTVDITFPSSPLFLYYNPELAKALLNHIFYYSESGKWIKPFAAHDVGTYPIANGQTYGGDMPVEESGNMLIITAAIAAIEGNAIYAQKHWNVLTTWADYLVEKGLDPDNQLCTDDFAGHFAHNTNLSIKAILAIASYGRLAAMSGKKEIAEKYTRKAKEMAREWIKMADDGNHFRLTFDQSGTWSQKYNLVWDKLLQLNIFPAGVAEKEIAYYLTKQNIYGLPLDNRKAYTKADWIMWTATLSDDKAVFERFISPLYKFMNETTSRVPMTDWYWTDKPEQRGFQARSVVGGFFIKLLETKLSSNN
ncbi:MAG: DUF4965 domain-containing protein [Tannerella sp.]|jgi:flagellin-like hook-associated protein FlgL|nr:DUF4965 domain-containing protein [Tannerella sp.]